MINLSRLNPLRIPALFLLLALLSFADQATRYVPQLSAHFSYWQEGRDLPWNDFMVHWSVARSVQAGRPQDAYDVWAVTASIRDNFGFFRGIEKMNAHTWPYFYPPTNLLVIKPLALFNYPQAALLFFSLTFLALSVLAILYIGPIGSILLLGAPAVWICLWEGQNGFLTASLLGFFLLLMPKNKAGAGAMLAGLLIKPHLALVAPFALLSGKERKIFFSAALCGAFLLLLTRVMLNSAVWGAFLAKGIPRAELFILTNSVVMPRLVSLYGTLRVAGVSPEVALSLQFFWGTGCILLAIWVFQRTRDYDLRAAVLALSALMISPMAYDYDLPISLVAIFALLRAGRRVPLCSWEWGLIAAVYFLPAFIYPDMANRIGFNPVWLALTLLYVAVLRRVAQATEMAVLRPL